MRTIRRGWRDRGHMPHADFAGLAQAVTFRLADALPESVLQRLRAAVVEDKPSSVAGQRQDALLAERIHAWLDAGHGSCCLGQPDICRLLLDEIRAGHGTLYRLDAVVIMPNHVHVLMKSLGEPLGTIIGGWKGRSGRSIHRQFGGVGHLWQREYFDRFIRDDEHHIAAVRYVAQNPVRAGLVRRPDDWPGLWIDERWRWCIGGGAAG